MEPAGAVGILFLLTPLPFPLIGLWAGIVSGLPPSSALPRPGTLRWLPGGCSCGADVAAEEIESRWRRAGCVGDPHKSSRGTVGRSRDPGAQGGFMPSCEPGEGARSALAVASNTPRQCAA